MKGPGLMRPEIEEFDSPSGTYEDCPVWRHLGLSRASFLA